MSGTPTFGDIARRLVLALIEREPDPAERKCRIMIAREHGHITDAEASDLIGIHDLVAA